MLCKCLLRLLESYWGPRAVHSELRHACARLHSTTSAAASPSLRALLPYATDTASIPALTKEQLHSFGSPEVLASWWPCTAHPADERLAKAWTPTQLKKMRRMDSGKAWKASNLLQLLLAAPAMEPFYLLLREQPGPQNLLARVQVVENRSKVVNMFHSWAELLVKVRHGCGGSSAELG